MIKFIVMSDIHNEFEQYRIPPLPEIENDIYLILAGDIGIFEHEDTFKNFIIDCATRFKGVIWVAGNHEYYHGSFHRSFDNALRFVDKLENVFLLEKDVVVDEDEKIVFVGTTLWSDFDKNNPVMINNARSWMSDYRYISSYLYDENGNHDGNPWRARLQPTETYLNNLIDREWLFKTIDDYKSNGYKIIVVTHHAPSYQSIPDDFKNDMLNGAYATELYEEIAVSKPDVWIHGHIHETKDYMIEDTRIICNPRGYPNEIATGFRADNIIEL